VQALLSFACTPSSSTSRCGKTGGVESESGDTILIMVCCDGGWWERRFPRVPGTQYLIVEGGAAVVGKEGNKVG
jgi:hypothetical protein